MAVERLQLEPLAPVEVLVERGEVPRRDGARQLHDLVHDVRGEPGLRRRGQGGPLLGDRAEHPPGLRRVANDADGAARERGHAGHRADEDVLLPERAPDVRRELGVDGRARKGLAQALDPWRHSPVQLAEDDPAEEVMRDDSRAVDGGEHLGDAAHRVAGAQDRVDRVLVVDAVLEGQHRGGGPDDRADALGGGLRVE